MAPATKPTGPAAHFRRFATRLARQADRTARWRHPLYERVGLATAKDVLDVGCGTGAVTRDLCARAKGALVAVDSDPKMVAEAQEVLADLPRVEVRQADAHQLPFPDASFDLVVTNLVLMWVRDPESVVTELARVTRPGGTVLASMEPDYGGKIHFPENPVVDQIFREEMIRNKGGDPHAGRKLRTWFVRAGLDAEVGLSNPEIPSCEEDLESYQLEKGFYRHALQEAGLAPAKIRSWEQDYVASLRAGTQLNYLPLFYAIGRKKAGAPGRPAATRPRKV